MGDPTSPDRAKQLVQVVGLAATVADRILDAQIAGRPIPPEQLTSLIGAAQLLKEHGMDWPPLVEQVLYEFAERLDGIENRSGASGPASAGEDVAAGLTRFFAAFRREKGLAPEA